MGGRFSSIGNACQTFTLPSILNIVFCRHICFAMFVSQQTLAQYHTAGLLCGGNFCEFFVINIFNFFVINITSCLTTIQNFSISCIHCTTETTMQLMDDEFSYYFLLVQLQASQPRKGGKPGNEASRNYQRCSSVADFAD